MVAEALKKSGSIPHEKTSDCIVYFTPEHFREAEAYRRSQANAGRLAELAAFETYEETMAYAAARGIPTIATVDGTGVKEEKVQTAS